MKFIQQLDEDDKQTAPSFVVKDKKMLHRLELLKKIYEDDRETILSGQ